MQIKDEDLDFLDPIRPVSLKGIHRKCIISREMYNTAETLVLQKRKDGNQQSYGKQANSRTLKDEVHHHLQGYMTEKNWYDYLGVTHEPLNNARQYFTRRPDLQIECGDGDVFRAEIRTVTCGKFPPALIVRHTDEERRDRADYILYGNDEVLVGCCAFKDLLKIAKQFPLVAPNGGAPIRFVPLEALCDVQESAETVKKLVEQGTLRLQSQS